MRMTTLAILTALIASPAMADSTKNADGEHKDHKMEHSGEMEKKMVETPATVNSVSETSLNVSHPAIPDLKWPAMTMDLPVLEGAEIADLKEGGKVIIVLEQGEDGNYSIRSAKPAE